MARHFPSSSPSLHFAPCGLPVNKGETYVPEAPTVGVEGTPGTGAPCDPQEMDPVLLVFPSQLGLGELRELGAGCGLTYHPLLEAGRRALSTTPCRRYASWPQTPCLRAWNQLKPIFAFFPALPPHLVRYHAPRGSCGTWTLLEGDHQNLDLITALWVALKDPNVPALPCPPP